MNDNRMLSTDKIENNKNIFTQKRYFNNNEFKRQSFAKNKHNVKNSQSLGERKNILNQNKKNQNNESKKNDINTQNKSTQNKNYPNKKTNLIQPKTSSNLTPKTSSNKVKISFLGGVGEIGKNMTVFETDNDIIILDCGMSFADETLPGVDNVIPDISYLTARSSKIRGIIITHGHEDHIGALPYVLKEIKVPVYGSAMALGLIDDKMKEHSKIKYKAIMVKPRNILKMGDFVVEFINSNHSIAGAFAVAISTPAGLIFHSGDFKIDNHPINSKPIDLQRIAELGKKGITLLMCESTNICKSGYSVSESSVGPALEESVFKAYKNHRLIVATFASNVHRIQQVMDLAEKYKRKVVFTGRSMLNITEIGMKIGEIKYNRDNVIPVEDTKKYSDSEILVLTTGSQGEVNSALTRMANDEFAKLKLRKNDCVVFSSSPIPGNESHIINVINKLVKKEVEIVTIEKAQIHASGHAHQEEIKKIYQLTKPKFYIPVHGENLHLKTARDLALANGFNERQIFIAEIGTQFELSPTTIKKLPNIKAGIRLVDGGGLGDLSSSVIKDRLQLADDGFVVVILSISNKTLDFTQEPLIITRGLFYNNEIEPMTNQLKTAISVYVKKIDYKNTEQNEIKNNLRKFIANFIYKKIKRKPITLATIMFK